jgi:hypothetical protein
MSFGHRRCGLLPGGLVRDLEVGELLHEPRIGRAGADLLERGEVGVELLSVAAEPVAA